MKNLLISICYYIYSFICNHQEIRAKSTIWKKSSRGNTFKCYCYDCNSYIMIPAIKVQNDYELVKRNVDGITMNEVRSKFIRGQLKPQR